MLQYQPAPSKPLFETKPPPSRRADIALGIAVAGLSVFLFWQTLDWTASAAIFPRIVAALLFLFGLLNAAQALRRAGAGMERFLTDPGAFVKVWAAILLYFGGIVIVGFSIATILLVMSVAAMFGYRRWTFSLLAGVIFVTLTLVVFGGLFDRPLPSGLIAASIFD